MKKLILMLIGVFALIASSCTNEASLQGDEPQAPERSAIRTEAEAIQIALQFANEQQPSRNALTVDNVKKIYASLSRSEENPLIYAVNFTANAGFALISGSKNGQDVLGYTENGTFNENVIHEDSGFSFFLNSAKNYVSNQLKTASIGDIELPNKPIIEQSSVMSQILVEWGQDYPERMFMPLRTDRFELTAVAQLLSYVKKPESIILTYPTRDIDVLNLNWQEIMQHSQSITTDTESSINQHLSNCQASEATHQNLGRLFAELANRFDTSHPGEEVRRNIQWIRYIFRTITNNSVEIGNAINYVGNNELMLQMTKKLFVAYMMGFDANGKVYAWLCDGGKLTKKTEKLTLWTGEVETVVTYTSMNHYNWGDCGIADGLYYDGVFERNDGEGSYGNNVQYFIVQK